MTFKKVTSLLSNFRADLKLYRLMGREERTHNSSYPKGGVSCSKGSFVVNGSLVFQIKFCGKSPALRVAANRQTV